MTKFLLEKSCGVLGASLVVFGILGVPQTYGGDGSTTNSEGQITVAFNDRSIYRISEDSAPQMGTGEEDFFVRIACFDARDCQARIPHVFSLLSKRKLTKNPCKRSYARITITPAGYGKDDQKQEFDADYSGACVTYKGEYFKLPKSIFSALNRRIGDW